MLEARIVTADGNIITASEFENEDLFYAMRGGGFGFGVVISLTVRTHPLPKYMGGVNGLVRAKNEDAGKELFKEFLDFYKSNLIYSGWGEQVNFGFDGQNYLLRIGMTIANFTEQEITEAWAPFATYVQSRPDDYEVGEWSIIVGDGHDFWNVDFLSQMPGFVHRSPYDPGEPNRAFFWGANVGEISIYWMYYVSRYLRVDQFLDDTEAGMEKIATFAKKTGNFGIHFNKAQYGVSEWILQEFDKTPMHPSIKESFGLMIQASGVSHYTPLVKDELQHNTSNIQDWLNGCQGNLETCPVLDSINEALHELQENTPGAGSYFNEADYFELNWQDNFWGMENYERLLLIKQKWDPQELFYCHNCIGSEDWEEGGMCKH